MVRASTILHHRDALKICKFQANDAYLNKHPSRRSKDKRFSREKEFFFSLERTFGDFFLREKSHAPAASGEYSSK